MSARKACIFIKNTELVREMAEQQDEMSMNEILSSIKNILVEGENPAASSASGFTPPEPHSAGEEKVVPAEPVLTDSLDIEKSDLDLSELKLEDSDILELSPDMAVEPAQADALPAVTPVAEEINLADELAGVNLTPEIVDDKGDDLPEPEIDGTEEPEVGFDQLIEQNVQAEINEEEQNNAVIDVESEPYYEEPASENTELPELPAPTEEAVQAENFDNISTAADSKYRSETEQYFTVPENAVAEMSWPEPAESKTEPVLEDNIEPAPIVAPAEMPVVSAPEPQMAAPAPAPEAFVAEPAKEPAIENVPAVDEDVADVSANIINNFAKLFAKEETPAPEAVRPSLGIAPVSDNIRLGNASQTLEDMLKVTLQGLVADWVSGAKSNIDLYDLVSKEVARQTKVWLDANLPAVVEGVVKKEIERVMVKVGRS